MLKGHISSLVKKSKPNKLLFINSSSRNYSTENSSSQDNFPKSTLITLINKVFHLSKDQHKYFSEKEVTELKSADSIKAVLDAKRVSIDTEKIRLDQRRFKLDSARAFLTFSRILISIVALYFAYLIQNNFQKSLKLKDDLNKRIDEINNEMKELRIKIRQLDDERDAIPFLHTVAFNRKADFADSYELLSAQANDIIKQIDNTVRRLKSIQLDIKKLRDNEIANSKLIKSVFKSFGEDLLSNFTDLERECEKYIADAEGSKQLLSISLRLNNLKIDYKLGDLDQKRRILSAIITLYEEYGCRVFTFKNDDKQFNQTKIITDEKNAHTKEIHKIQHFHAREIFRRIVYQLACYLITEDNLMPDLGITKIELKNAYLNLEKKNPKSKDIHYPSVVALYILKKLLRNQFEDKKNATKAAFKCVNNLIEDIEKQKSDKLKFFILEAESHEYKRKELSFSVKYLDLVFTADDDEFLDLSEFQHAYARYYNRLGMGLTSIHNDLIIYNNEEYFQAGREFYQESLSEEGSNIQAYFNMAGSYIQQNNYESAMPWIEKAFILKPNLNIVVNFLAETLARLGYIEKGEEYADKLHEELQANDAYVAGTTALMKNLKAMHNCFKDGITGDFANADSSYGACLQSAKDLFNESFNDLKLFKNFDRKDERMKVMALSIKAEAYLMTGNVLQAKKTAEKYLNTEGIQIETFRYYPLLITYAEILHHEQKSRDALRAVFQAYLTMPKESTTSNLNKFFNHKGNVALKNRISYIFFKIIQYMDNPEKEIYTIIWERKTKFEEENRSLSEKQKMILKNEETKLEDWIKDMKENPTWKEICLRQEKSLEKDSNPHP